MLVEPPTDAALGRPFSIAGAPGDRTLELLVERRGRVTEALCALPEGAAISLIGPLGNGFTPPAADETAVLVAGGIGAAGLRYLARSLDAGATARFLVGARTREHLLDRVFPAGDRFETAVATDDGTAGRRGTVCDLLAETLDTTGGPARVYCCGPPGMIRGAAAIAAARGVPCEASVEEIMACGVGACRGCVVATRDGYRAACTDGPVFDTAELLFEGAPDDRT